ncbi:MAG: hypothetical protein LBH60_01230 [Prevotellaceae bacterium]|jgi:ParB-like chromosome segregation protein Spo0J|nr:hypothetical protein [Prevotellaceae bacterium]
MSEAQHKRQKQIKLARIEIVAELYKKGWSYRQIQREVMRRLNLKSYSTASIHKDVHGLLAEWRETRIESIDFAVQLELERIDDTIRELWAQWEKSKEDYTRTSNKRKGKPVGGTSKPTETEIRTIERETQETEMRCFGDVSYVSEIRAQLVERRKLLGLYAPEKRELTGKGGKDLTFEPITIEIIDSRDKVVDAEDTDLNSI